MPKIVNSNEKKINFICEKKPMKKFINNGVKQFFFK